MCGTAVWFEPEDGTAVEQVPEHGTEAGWENGTGSRVRVWR